MAATVSPSLNYTLRLPRDPRSPSIGRVTLRAVLAARDLAELTPTAELLATELLTNAHQHTKGPYALRIVDVAGRLRVAVWDNDWRVPDGFEKGASGLVPASSDSERGRGCRSCGPVPRTGAWPCCGRPVRPGAGS